ncbi:hypothetical protein [Deinococcus koreensis]|uniref:Uncharacterized protein n=1 Tax=Deinococcus koreensis TaxID=2054903 RepID=A0A2K3UUM8_9DEIO|nr:hypothetical protein [Deinococcus koreensis]PNY80246.1 hypothetical protein CVO96_01715 [Deinococcus koreensis]
MPKPVRRLSLLLVLGLYGAAPLAAALQTPTADLFSKLSPAERDLLLASAGVSSGDQFRPGVLAPGLVFPVASLANREVVGSVTQPQSTLVVLRTSLAPAAAQKMALDTLRRAGWIDQYSQPNRDVFQSSPGAGETFYPQCKPGVPGSLTVMSQPGARTGSAQVTYRYSVYAGFDSGCPANSGNDPTRANFYSPERTATYTDPLKDMLDQGLRLPLLAAPAGADVQSSGSSYGRDEYSTYATVYTTLSAEQIRSHYVGALKPQGWAATGFTTLNSEQITRFKFRQGNREREGTLALMPRPELGRDQGGVRQARYDVQLQIR